MNVTITRPPRRIAVSWGLIRAGVYLAFHRKVTLPGYGTAGLPLPVPVKAIGHDERIHARSVSLSSDRLGLIAKLDLVEAEDGAVVPVRR